MSTSWHLLALGCTTVFLLLLPQTRPLRSKRQQKVRYPTVNNAAESRSLSLFRIMQRPWQPPVPCRYRRRGLSWCQQMRFPFRIAQGSWWENVSALIPLTSFLGWPSKAIINYLGRQYNNECCWQSFLTRKYLHISRNLSLLFIRKIRQFFHGSKVLRIRGGSAFDIWYRRTSCRTDTMATGLINEIYNDCTGWGISSRTWAGLT